MHILHTFSGLSFSQVTVLQRLTKTALKNVCIFNGSTAAPTKSESYKMKTPVDCSEILSFPLGTTKEHGLPRPIPRVETPGGVTPWKLKRRASKKMHLKCTLNFNKFLKIPMNPRNFLHLARQRAFSISRSSSPPGIRARWARARRVHWR